MSKTQADKMGLASKGVEENPQLLVKAMKDVQSSYSDLNREMVKQHIVYAK